MLLQESELKKKLNFQEHVQLNQSPEYQEVNTSRNSANLSQFCSGSTPYFLWCSLGSLFLFLDILCQEDQVGKNYIKAV